MLVWYCTSLLLVVLLFSGVVLPVSLHLLLSGNFWIFLLRPVDGHEQYDPGIMVILPFRAYMRTPSSQPPLKVSHMVHSPIHSCVCLSLSLLSCGQHWFLQQASMSIQCVCGFFCACGRICFPPSVYDLSQGACIATHAGKERKK